jgi:hypothetical protein
MIALTGPRNRNRSSEPAPEPVPEAEPLMPPDVPEPPDAPVVPEVPDVPVVPVVPDEPCVPVALPLVEVPVEVEPAEEFSVSVLPLRVSFCPQPARPKAAAKRADAAVIFNFFVFMFFPKVTVFLAGPDDLTAGRPAIFRLCAEAPLG